MGHPRARRAGRAMFGLQRQVCRSVVPGPRHLLHHHPGDPGSASQLSSRDRVRARLPGELLRRPGHHRQPRAAGRRCVGCRAAAGPGAGDDLRQRRPRHRPPHGHRATPTEDARHAALRRVATEFVTLVEQVEGGVPTDPSSVPLQVVSGPNVRQVPTRPSLSVALRGFLGGLLVGLGIAVAAAPARPDGAHPRPISTPSASSPCSGSIPLDRRERFSELYAADRIQTATAESFRHLRTNLQFLDVDRPVQVLVVSSSVPAEGKSFVSRNLALTIAAADLGCS